MKYFLIILGCSILFIAACVGLFQLSNIWNMKECIAQSTFFNAPYTYHWWYGCQIYLKEQWWWWNYHINTPPGPGPI